jgi:hypothetical protein
MKYLLCTILLVIAIGTTGGAFYYPPHSLTLIPAAIAFSCIGFGCFLFDPSGFLAFSADTRKSLTCWLKRGDA